VLFYLAGFALIVLPLMLAELALGRRGRSDAIRSILNVASAAAASPRWGFVGAIGVVAGFLILSFYSVIGGWAIAYLVDTVRIGLPAGDAQAAQARFDACAPLRSSWRSITLSSWRSRRRSSPAASPAASRRRQKS
jgi:NSS family neurotransmitter:Na+ symporter